MSDVPVVVDRLIRFSLFVIAICSPVMLCRWIGGLAPCRRIQCHNRLVEFSLFVQTHALIEFAVGEAGGAAQKNKCKCHDKALPDFRLHTMDSFGYKSTNLRITEC